MARPVESTHEAPADTGVSDTLQFAAAVASCGVGIWALGPRDQLRTDDTFLSIWGRTREELIHAEPAWPVNSVHTDDRAGAEAVFGLRQDARLATEMLFRVVRPDGQSRWVLCRRRSCEDGAHELPTGVVLDLTSFRRGDDSRLRETVATLAGRLTHDFNNLLFAILGNATLALGTIQVPQDHPIRESLREIERAANRASEIVQRVAAFARPVQPRRQLLQLGPLVDAALRSMHGSLPARVNVRVHLPAANEPAVLLDSKLVKDLIVSLLSNAFQASEGRSEIVHVGIDEVALQDEPWLAELGIRAGRYLELRVHDEGPGMDPVTLERASEPFFSTRTRSGGMGLGLSIAQGIVKSHGGALRIESQLEHGTTVFAYFPVP